MRWALWGIKGRCPKCGSNNVEVGRLWPSPLLSHCGWCGFMENVNQR